MASSSRRLSPRDRLPAMRVALLGKADILEHCLGLVADLGGFDPPRGQALMRKAPSRLANAGIMTFSSTVRSRKISGVWKTRATPSWLISCGCMPSSDLPSKTTVPGIGGQAADEDS